MTSDSNPNILARLVAPARAARPPGYDDLFETLAMVMPRNAMDVMGLSVRVDDVVCETVTKAQIPDSLGPYDLIYQLECDGLGGGLCTLSPELLAGVTQFVVAGRVTGPPARQRAPSDIDGLVVGDLLDRWLVTCLGGKEDCAFALPGACRRSTRMPDRRTVELAIEPARYQVMRVEMTLEDGKGQGQVTFIVPSLAAEQVDEGQDVRKEFVAVLKDVNVHLTASLGQVHMPLSRVRSLEAGQVLELPRAALEAVVLAHSEGSVAAKGKLGQRDGHRAVRIASGVDREDEVSDVRVKSGPASVPNSEAAAASDGLALDVPPTPKPEGQLDLAS